MIKVKVVNLLASRKALQNLINEKLPPKTSYVLARAVREIDKELETYEKTRQSLVKELGTEDEKGNLSVREENMPEFQEQLQEVLDTEIELAVDTIPVSILGDISITPRTMLDAFYLFSEEE